MTLSSQLLRPSLFPPQSWPQYCVRINDGGVAYDKQNNYAFNTGAIHNDLKPDGQLQLRENRILVGESLQDFCAEARQQVGEDNVPEACTSTAIARVPLDDMCDNVISE